MTATGKLLSEVFMTSTFLSVYSFRNEANLHVGRRSGACASKLPRMQNGFGYFCKGNFSKT